MTYMKAWMSSKFDQISPLVSMATDRAIMAKTVSLLFMPPTSKKLMGYIAFGACVSGCVGGSHFLYLL